jgi:hypothetical protein
MTKRYLARPAVALLLPGLLLLAFLGVTTANAQIDGLPNLVKGGAGDANSFMQAYLRPLGQSFGAGMNSGWYNTARTHRTLGVSVTAFVSLASVPGADQSFDVASLGLQNFRVASGGNTSPTLAGSNSQGPLLDILAPNPFFNVVGNPQYASIPLAVRTSLQNTPVPGFTQTLGNIDRLPMSTFAGGSPLATSINSQLAVAGGSFAGVNTSTQIRLPQGLNVPFMPALGGIQVSVGIYKHIDLMVRYLPPLSFTQGDGRLDLGYWGIGAKIGFKQWIPVFKDLPFDMALVAGYTSLTSNLQLRALPEGGVTFAAPAGTDFSNQRAVFTATGYNVGLAVSKKLLFLTVYGGVRYERATVGLRLQGNYPITVPDLRILGGVPTGGSAILVLSDPVNISYSNPNSIAATLGFRLKFLWLLTLHADYTFANYSVLSTGLGLDIRERK